MARSIGIAVLMTCVAATATAQVITQNYISNEYEYFDGSNDSPAAAGPLLTGGLYPPSYYHAGDVDYYRIDVTDVPSTLTVLVEGIKTLFGDGDPMVWLENDLGSILVQNDDIAYPVNLDSFIRYVFTTPGDYYVGTRHASGWSYNLSNYYLSGAYQYIEADVQVPTYTGEGGVRRALRLRLLDPTKALVSWYAASDNRTPSDGMQYNVYRGTTSDTVFTAFPVVSFTGVVEGIVGGLSTDPAIEYWFGVRAEDEAGNEEQNTRVVKLEDPLAVPSSHWLLYR